MSEGREDLKDVMGLKLGKLKGWEDKMRGSMAVFMFVSVVNTSSYLPAGRNKFE